MHTPKPISKESVPRALSKVVRYRLLNEPLQAESICRDVLAVDPENQEALIGLILSIMDMFGSGGGGGDIKVDDALPLTERLKSPFDRLYYEGVTRERWARTLLAAGYPAASVSRWFLSAMTCFDDAQKLAAAGNDDAVLRWNACARTMDRNRLDAADGPDEEEGNAMSDDVPVR